MVGPAFSVIRLWVPGPEANIEQDLIFVYHGDSNDESNFTRSRRPISLHLGEIARSWRSEFLPELQMKRTCDTAIRARRGEDNWGFLQPPTLQDDLSPKPHWLHRVVAILTPITLVAVLFTLMFGIAIFSVRLGRVDEHYSPLSPYVLELPAPPPSPSPPPPPPLLPPPLSYKLFHTIPVTRILHDLVSNFHPHLQDNLEILEEEFLPEIEVISQQLRSSEATNMVVGQVNNSRSNTLHIPNLLNAIITTLREQRQERVWWEIKMMEKWSLLSAQWSWLEPTADPKRDLPGFILGNGEAAHALLEFVNHVVTYNTQMYVLVQENVCLAENSIRAYYKETVNALNLLSKQITGLLLALERRANRGAKREYEINPLYEGLVGIVRHRQEFIDIARVAATRTAMDIKSMCAVLGQASSFEWRFPASILLQDSTHNPVTYIDERRLEFLGLKEILGTGWDKYNIVGYNLTAAEVIEERKERHLTEVWLSLPSIDEVVDDVMDITKIVSGIR